MTTRVLEDGEGQFVEIPREYEFSCDEVYVDRIGETVILSPYNVKENEIVDLLEKYF